MAILENKKKQVGGHFMLEGLLIGVQFFFSCIVGIYFLTQLKGQSSSKTNIYKDSIRKMEDMSELRKIVLTKPLSEKVRPKCEEDIIGQKDGMKALKTALCGPNPQHVLIYGSPGVGKTAAARIVLEIAKSSAGTPFRRNAKFIEIDATTLRFDERSIADPLIGSVHDPIYQGAGAYGQAGVPQPKPGAVTKAHGGVLFIDEIGELHSVQMNKLLKVLEDRKVFLESSYYSVHDENIPRDIHDVFTNGLPADFRLIGATTRSPEDIPPALRSRCIEIFFDDLKEKDILEIISIVSRREEINMSNEAKELIGGYAVNGRDAVNMLQSAYSLVQLEGRFDITKKDVEWVIQTGHYAARVKPYIDLKDSIGKINGLGVLGNGEGMVLNIEAVAKEVGKQYSKVKVSGIVEEEEMQGKRSKTKRKSMAVNSVENVLTLLKIRYNVNVDEYLLHINYTSGIPIDGPSAGVAMFCVLYSALFNKIIPGNIAMTGEISIRGKVCPVGGVYEKVMAAKDAGIKKVFIPKANMQDILKNIDIEIVPVESIEQVISILFEEDIINEATTKLHA